MACSAVQAAFPQKKSETERLELSPDEGFESNKTLNEFQRRQGFDETFSCCSTRLSYASFETVGFEPTTGKSSM